MDGEDSISQEALKDLLLAEISEHGLHYRKSTKIKARRAVPGEHITTITSDGVETEKVAEPHEYLVENQTGAKEIYLVPENHFETRYESTGTAESGWMEYLPSGEIAAIVVSDQVLQKLGRTGTFSIVANWGSGQRVEPGDYLVTPLPNRDEIYRIGKKEFEQTYTSTL